MASATHRGRTTCLVVIAVLVLVAIGLLVWRGMEARQTQERLAAQRAALLGETQQALQTRTNELLHMLAAPIAWALRAPLAARDLRPVHALFKELASEPNLRELLLVDAQGQVVAATNAVRLGAPLGDDIPVQGRDAAVPTVVPHTAGTAFLFVPVTAAEGARLGTVVVYYQGAPPPAGGG